MMKNLLLILPLLLSTAGAFANEQTAVWQRLYDKAVNDDMRYEILLNIRQLHDTQYGPLLTQALADLDSRQIT